MRILYVTQWFDPEPAFKGLTFAKNLASLGHKIEVLTGFPNYPGGKIYKGYKLRPWQSEVRDGVNIHRVYLYPSHNSSTLHRALNYISFCLSCLIFLLINARRFDAIYVYHPPITPALATALATLLWRKPFVVEIQDLWPDTVATSGMAPEFMVRSLNWACNFVYRRSAAIIVQSDGMKERLVERGVAATKITRIYNSSNYLPAGSQSEAVSVDFVRNFSGHFNFVYGGNLGQAQDLAKVIEAARLATLSCPALKLHLVGNGIEAVKLAQIISQQNLTCVQIYPPISRSAMDRVFEIADVLVVNLEPDLLYTITIPSKLQHYLSVGKPVLAGLHGEAAGLLKLADAGLVCTPGVLHEMAAAMVKLYNLTVPARAAMGARGKAFYMDTMGLEAALTKTNAVLNGLGIVGKG